MNRPMMRLTTALTFPFLLCTWILAGMSSMSAFAHPLGTDFSTATDLGATISWTDGRTDTAARLTEENGVNFFQFRVSSRGPVQMWTAGLWSWGYLYDSDEVLLASSSGHSGNFSIAQTLDPGIYYLRIFGGGGAVGAYRLHLDTETGDDDYSDSFEGATRVSLPGQAAGQMDDMNRNPLCCPRDHDVFWFRVAVAGTVRMWTAGLWTWGYLHDSDEVLLVSSSGHSGNINIAQTLDPGIYYLTIFPGGGAVGAYRLHLESDTGV